MKTCVKCEIEKNLEEFYKEKKAKDGLCGKCKNCIKEYNRENKEKINQKHKEYYEKNKEEISRYQKEYLKKYREENKEEIRKYREKNREKLKQQQREYREENKENIKQQKKEHYRENAEQIKESIKKYRKENVEKIRKYRNEYVKERRKNDPQFRIACDLRRSTNRGIISQGGVKSASTEQLLGCSFYEAYLYIENLFTEGMTWENHGGWEIDHIRPIASFDLTDPEQQKLCFHWSNLQPLWWEDNNKKNSIWNGIKY